MKQSNWYISAPVYSDILIESYVLDITSALSSNRCIYV